MSASDLQRDDAYSFGVVEKVSMSCSSRSAVLTLIDRVQDCTSHDSLAKRQGHYQARAVQRFVNPYQGQS